MPLTVKQRVLLGILLGGIALLLAATVVIDQLQRRSTDSLDELKRDAGLSVPDDRIHARTDTSLLSGMTLPAGRQGFVGVVIDHHPDARAAQRGLGDASAIIELPVEGGTTRLLALFDTQHAQFAGPVRSLRPQIVQLMAGLGGALVHVGGSPAALTLLPQLPLRDIDEQPGSQLIVRDSRYDPPHNAFANIAEIFDQLITNRWPSRLTRPLFDFGTEPSGQSAQSIRVQRAAPAFAAAFVYDTARQQYRVSHGGQELFDGLSSVRPRTIAVLLTPGPAQAGLASGTGSGEALIFSGGLSQRVAWHVSDGFVQFEQRANPGMLPAALPGQVYLVLTQSGDLTFQ